MKGNTGEKLLSVLKYFKSGWEPTLNYLCGVYINPVSFVRLHKEKLDGHVGKQYNCVLNLLAC